MTQNFQLRNPHTHFKLLFLTSAIIGLAGCSFRVYPTSSVGTAPATDTKGEMRQTQTNMPGTTNAGCVRLSYESDDGIVLGKGTIEDLSYSPDGKWLAVGSTNGVHLYDTRDYCEARAMAVESRVTSVAFSPDAALLASGLSSGEINLWQVSDGRLFSVLEGHRYQIDSLAFSADGSTLLSWSRYDGEVLGWRLPEGTMITSIDKIGSELRPAISLDGSLMVSGFKSYIRLWNVPESTMLKMLKSPEEMRYIALSPDGEILASATNGEAIYLWGARSGEVFRQLNIDKNMNVSYLSFSPDGNLLGAAIDGYQTKEGHGAVLLWRVSDGGLVKRLEEPMEGAVARIAFSPDGEQLASATWNMIRIWRTEDGALITTLEGYGSVGSVAFSPDGRLLASNSSLGAIRLFKMTEEMEMLTVQDVSSPFGQPAYPLAFSPDGKLLAARTSDGMVLLWRVSDLSLSNTLDLGNEVWVNSLGFSPDGHLLAVGLWQGDTLLWNMLDDSFTVLKDRDCKSVNEVVFSPDGSILAAGTLDGAIYLWRMEDNSLIDIWRETGDSAAEVSSLSFAGRDRAYLISGSVDGIVRFWDLSGKIVNTLNVRSSIRDLALSPDGTLLATSNFNGVVQLWGLTNLSLLREFHDHKESVNSLVFSSDGKWLASGSQDGTIRIWSVNP